MFPIGDDNSERTITPIVTWTLIVVNVLVFVVELMSGDFNAFVTTWGAIPAEITNGEDLVTLLTSMFMHGSIMHILGNMMFLKVFGDNVEDALGHAYFLGFYLITGFAAHAAHIFFNPDSPIPTVGASGAISGVLGAYIVMFHRNRVNVLLGYFVTTVPAWMMIGMWAAMQFLYTWIDIGSADTAQTGGVAYAAHAGGFVAGVVLAFVARAMLSDRQARPVRAPSRRF